MSGSEVAWRPVPGWPCQVSEAGEIRGPSGRTLKPYDVVGYQHVLIRKRKLRVHRAVLLAFVGPCPDGQETRHLDGNRANNVRTNLAWGSRIEQAADRARHGTELRGEAKPGARLTTVQVHAIRRDPRPSRVVGECYGVSHTAVLRIRRGERWAAA